MAKRKQKKNNCIVTENRTTPHESHFNGDYRFVVYFARRNPQLFEAWYDSNARNLLLEADETMPLSPSPALPTLPVASVTPAPRKSGSMRGWIIAGLLSLGISLGIGGNQLWDFVNSKLGQQGQPPASQQELQNKGAPGTGDVTPAAGATRTTGGVTPVDMYKRFGTHPTGRSAPP